MNKLGIFSLSTGTIAIIVLLQPVFAQTTNANATATADQSLGQSYVGLAIAIISMAGTVFAAYLAQKAKMTGQAPNETDLRIARLLNTALERGRASEEKAAQLIDFTFKALPQQTQNIVEGSLPAIKVSKVTADVGKAQAAFQEGNDLLNDVEDKVQGK